MVTPTPPLVRIHAFLITKYKYSFVGGVGSDFLGYSIFLVKLLSEKTSKVLELILFIILFLLSSIYKKNTIQF